MKRIYTFNFLINFKEVFYNFKFYGFSSLALVFFFRYPYYPYTKSLCMCVSSTFFSNFIRSHLFISTFNMLRLFMVLFLWSHYLLYSFALAFFLISTLFLSFFFFIWNVFLSSVILFLGFEILIYVIILYFVLFLNICSSFWKILGYFNLFCRCILYFLFSHNNILWDLTSIIFVVNCVCVYVQKISSPKI